MSIGNPQQQERGDVYEYLVMLKIEVPQDVCEMFPDDFWSNVVADMTRKTLQTDMDQQGMGVKVTDVECGSLPGRAETDEEFQARVQREEAWNASRRKLSSMAEQSERLDHSEHSEEASL